VITIALSFGSLDPKLGAAGQAILYTAGIQGTADDVVSNTGQVLYATASNQDDAVFLQVVADTRDVSTDFEAGCQTYTSDFAKSRIRLFGCRRVNTRADASSLWAAAQSKRFGFLRCGLATTGAQLG
jgi:hypothetical protein